MSDHRFKDVIDMIESGIREDPASGDAVAVRAPERSYTARELLKEIVDETEFGVGFALALRQEVQRTAFSEVPANPCGVTKGALLIAAGALTRESAVQFLEALGGDSDTFLVVMGVSDGHIHALPLGREPFKPNFFPTWDLDQLVGEIGAGVWRVVAPKEPEFRDEVIRRMRVAGLAPAGRQED